MTTTMIRGLVVRLLLRRCLQPPRLCRSQIVWWFRIWTSQALKIIVPLSLCLTMLNLLELWDLWCLLLLWAKLAGFFCVYVFVWFNELSWPGWFILLLIVWNKLGFVWVFGFLSVLDFWVFFDFMILAMNLWGRTRKTDGFSAWVFGEEEFLAMGLCSNIHQITVWPFHPIISTMILSNFLHISMRNLSKLLKLVWVLVGFFFFFLNLSWFQFQWVWRKLIWV